MTDAIVPPEYVRGMVLRHRTRNRFLRVLNPVWRIEGRVYVRDTDGAGFELDNKARWLSRQYLDRTYVLHYEPEYGDTGFGS